MDETILYTQHLYHGRIVKLDLHEVRLPDGNHSKREVVQHPGAAAIVAVDADGKILLVRQFRIAAGKVLCEIPAGTLNGEEPPDQCATRELQEETGYKPGQLDLLTAFYPAPGYTTEFIHVYLATKLAESRLKADSDEFIEMDRVTLPEALDMIARGDIVDGKTIVGLMLAARRLDVLTTK
jgi:ADP-ribose pyrophosphatase